MMDFDLKPAALTLSFYGHEYPVALTQGKLEAFDRSCTEAIRIGADLAANAKNDDGELVSPEQAGVRMYAYFVAAIKTILGDAADEVLEAAGDGGEYETGYLPTVQAITEYIRAEINTNSLGVIEQVAAYRTS